jgi:hypothetical protein
VELENLALLDLQVEQVALAEAEAVVRYWSYQMPLLIQLYTIQQQGHMVL